jgi:hypothetical protein
MCSRDQVGHHQNWLSESLHDHDLIKGLPLQIRYSCIVGRVANGKEEHDFFIVWSPQ